MKICYYSSKSNNTQNFIERFKEYERYKITKGSIYINDPFVLFVPTYANFEGKNAIQKNVIDFIKCNYQNMIGVISSGNRNFGKLFGISGDIISRNCSVPLLYKYELAGTNKDEYEIKNILKGL